MAANAYIAKRRHRLAAPSVSEAFREYVRGKRVVLVGPSGYLTGLGQGASIDDYDVVVRVNLDSPVRPDLHARMYPDGGRTDTADVGSRTDVLYHVLFNVRHKRDLGMVHTEAECQAWVEDGVKFLVTRQREGNSRVVELRRVAGDLPIVTMDRRYNEALKSMLRSTPSTGVVAIVHLLGLPIRSLHVTGFSFYAHGSYRVGYGGFTEAEAAKGDGAMAWGQTDKRTVVHPQQPQMAYLRELYRADRRLSFDDYPASLLDVPPRLPAVTAIVPIKRHSERVPNKNIRLICGRPLLAWALDTLHRAERIDRVVVDTDSDEIAAIVREHSPRTEVVQYGEHRNANTIIAGDLRELEGEHFGQFHVTSPLLEAETIDRAVDAYYENLGTYDSLMSVTRHQSWFYDHEGRALNPTEGLPRTQDMPPVFEANSAIHLFSRASFEATGSRVGERVQFFEVPKRQAVDIDTEEDFALAEALLRGQREPQANPYERKHRRGA